MTDEPTDHHFTTTRPQAVTTSTATDETCLTCTNSGQKSLDLKDHLAKNNNSIDAQNHAAHAAQTTLRLYSIVIEHQRASPERTQAL
jgi:hypothetical protein